MTLWRRFEKSRRCRALGLGCVRNSIVECPQLLDISPCQSFQTERLKKWLKHRMTKQSSKSTGSKPLFSKSFKSHHLTCANYMWIKWNAFTLLIWLSCFHNLVFVFAFDTFPPFFICFSAPSVQRKCSRIFSKRRRSTFKAAVFPSTVMAELKCRRDHTVTSFQSSRPRLHIIAHFPWPVVISVISCNVS